jgi:tetratricopeptide (TPR) repeat protein
MTRPAVAGKRLWLATGSLAVLGLAGAFFGQERWSLERGNRLYREGRVREAVEVYQARAAGSERPPAPAAYNLGTALMTLGAAEAADYLRVAAEGGDSAAAQRGHYNLGYGYLAQFEDVQPDSALELLTAAVASNRAALRLDPADDDARWNLAFAGLMLDSLMRLTEEVVEAIEEDAPSDEEGGIVIRQVAQLGPRRGLEREATAGEDPPPMSEAEALALVRAVGPDVEMLIRGFLWSHRPDVAPWAEPYPGGNW